MPTNTANPPKATGTGAKTTTAGSSKTAQTGSGGNTTSKATAALKAAVTSKSTPPPKTTPKPTRGNASVEVEFLNNRVVFAEYQKGDLIGILEEAAIKLGMTGKVVAAALSHEGDQGNTGRSTWRVELRKPLVGNCDQIFTLKIRTEYEVPSFFGRK